MTLTLTIISQQAAAAAEAARTVDRDGLTIGRGPDNGWVLSDPDRHLSKRHCEIAFHGGEYVVTDTSTNGVYLNDSSEPLGRGQRAPLRDGDCLTLGDYRIEVGIAQDRQASDATMAARGPDPFAALLARDGPAADDLDPFGIDRDEAGGATGPSEPPAGAADQSAPLIPDDDELFGGGRRGEDWGAASRPDHVPSEQEFFRPPSVSREVIPEDWDEGWDKKHGVDEPMPPRDMAPAGPVPRRPIPDAERASAKPEPPRSQAPSPSPPGDAGAFHAFLSGAGLERSGIPDEDATELMFIAGETFREMVQGLREVLMARSTIKNEFRLEKTMIGPARNNPLKFSATPEEALAAMVRQAGPGYLTPVEAVQEGFKDIKAHQLAVMAGMQVALTALLGRFDPEGLKQRLAKGSVLDGILPGARKARYWELYEAFYREIAGEAEQDFHGLFGRAFARAYEEQVKKL